MCVQYSIITSNLFQLFHSCLNFFFTSVGKCLNCFLVSAYCLLRMRLFCLLDDPIQVHSEKLEKRRRVGNKRNMYLLLGRNHGSRQNFYNNIRSQREQYITENVLKKLKLRGHFWLQMNWDDVIKNKYNIRNNENKYTALCRKYNSQGRS